MSPLVIPLALLVLAIIGAALIAVAVGIYKQIGRLTQTLVELKDLAVGSQDELVKTQEGIGKVHLDLGRLVSSANVTSELVRSVNRLPTR